MGIVCNHDDDRAVPARLSKVDPFVSGYIAKQMWVVRHMDDYLMIGPRHHLKVLHEGMSTKLGLRDIVFLDQPGDTAQFLGWTVTRQRGL